MVDKKLFWLFWFWFRWYRPKIISQGHAMVWLLIKKICSEGLWKAQSWEWVKCPVFNIPYCEEVDTFFMTSSPKQGHVKWLSGIEENGYGVCTWKSTHNKLNCSRTMWTLWKKWIAIKAPQNIRDSWFFEGRGFPMYQHWCKMKWEFAALSKCYISKIPEQIFHIVTNFRAGSAQMG